MSFSTLSRFFRNFRIQLLLIVLANVVFLVLYRLYFEHFVAELVFRNQDPLNHDYYKAILDNMEFAGYSFSAVMLLLVLFYDRLRDLIRYFAARETLFLALCLILLASAQLCLITFIKTVPIYDSVEYLKLGNRLITQHAYVSDSGMPTAFWPVGYPAFLAFLRFFSDNNILLAKYVNVIISGGLVVVTFRVFRQWLSPDERIIFILVTAFLPNLIFSSNVLLTDYPFTLLLWLVVLIYLKRPRSPIWFAVIGLLLAVMSYLRPVALLLPIIFLVSLWKDGEFLSHRMSLILGGLVFVGVLVPWTVRNYSAFGALVPISTNGGYNFYMGNRLGASGGEDHSFIYNFNNPNEVSESSRVFNLGVYDIVHDPVDAISKSFKKIYQMYRRYDSSNTWAMNITENYLEPRFVGLSFYFANALFYLILYIGLIVFAIKGPGLLPIPMARVLAGLYLYLVIMTLVFFGNDRYLIPLMPIHQFLCAKFMSVK